MGETAQTTDLLRDPPGPPAESDHSSTAQRIVDAALACFVEKGIDAATTREIAHAAGVNEVTVFRHFHNKRGLVQAVLESASPVEPLRAQLSGSLTYEDLRADLTVIGRTISEVWMANAPRIKFSLQNAATYPEVVEISISMRNQLLGLLGEYFQTMAKKGKIRSAAPAELAPLFVGPFVMRVLFRAFMGPGHEDGLNLDEIQQLHVEMFVRAWGQQ